VKTEAGAELTWNAHHQRVASLRKNLYLATNDGVRKLTATNDLVASLAGMSTALVIRQIDVTGVTGFLAHAPTYAAYSLVLRRTDDNNLVTRSIGLGTATVGNATGNNTNVVMTIALDSSVAAGDCIEIYRTHTTTVLPPSREFFLVSEHEVTSADVSAGSYAYTDTTLDSLLGAALYCNDSREGVEAANFRAPMAKELATFNGSLFFANTISASRLALRWKDVGSASGATTGVGYRTINGTRTNLSSVIAMADVVGLQVGMMLDVAASWSGTDPVVITSIVGNNVTMGSKTWGGATDGAPTALTFVDTIRVTSASLTGTQEYYPAAQGQYGLTNFLSGHLAFLLSLQNGLAATRNVAHPEVYAYTADEYYRYAGGPTSSLIATIVLEERARHGSGFTARATHNTDYLKPVAAMSAGSGTALLADTQPSAIFWSKTDEPEHVPLPYFEPVGAQDAAILRIERSRDALWIFKEDGLWRLSGVAAPGWRIDLFDPTVRLMHPDTLVALGDTIYFMSTRGPMMVTDAGVFPMGYPGMLRSQIHEDFEPFMRLYSDDASWPSEDGLWMTADETSGNVVLGLILSGTTYIYVYNVGTREWTNWDGTTGALDDIVHMVFEPVSGRLVVANGDYAVQRVADGAGGVVNADYQINVTVSAVAANGVDLTLAAGTYVPVVGDAIKQAGHYYVVTATPNATHVTVHAAGVTAAAAVAYEGVDCEIQYLAQGTPIIVKHWQAMNVAFHNLNGAYQLTAPFATDKDQAAVAPRTLTYVAPSSATERPQAVRFYVPRVTSLAQLLFPGFAIRQAAANWRVAGAALFYEDATERVSR
jgi:hypothetical protein